VGLATAVVPKRRRDAAALYDYPIARSTFGAHGRSQDYEDFALYEQFFEGQHSGRFAEMGALDGIIFSNTYAFEKVLGWTGVLIEANPRFCTSLQRNRPLARSFCTAVSHDYSVLSFSQGLYSTTFAAVDDMAPKFKELFHRRPRPHITVPSQPLGQLLRSAGVSYLDLFSLDVEGSEMKVLRTMDWSIPVRVWCIEWNAEHSPKSINASIASLMSEKGYKRHSWLHEFDSARPLSQNQLWVWGGEWSPSQYTWRQWQAPRSLPT